MARPRADNYDERRRNILDGAAAMFAQHGFDGTSIARIAQYLGFSKALLYHYYQSKEALLYDMLRLHCELLSETAGQASSEGDDAETQLNSVIRALMHLYMSSRDKHVVLLNNLHCLPSLQQKQIRNLQRRVLQVLRELLARLRPDLNGPALSALAMYLMGAINWTYTWFDAKGPLSEEQFADLATITFLDGVHGAPAL